MVSKPHARMRDGTRIKKPTLSERASSRRIASSSSFDDSSQAARHEVEPPAWLATPRPTRQSNLGNTDQYVSMLNLTDTHISNMAKNTRSIYFSVDGWKKVHRRKVNCMCKQFVICESECACTPGVSCSRERRASDGRNVDARRARVRAFAVR